MSTVSGTDERRKRMRLRRWQQTALQRFETSGASDFLAVATPGAGKTTLALAACVRALEARRVRRIVVVTPTQHLKHQWARAAASFGLVLEPEWTRADGVLPADLHGVVVTYQQISANPTALRPIAHGGFVILDEIHHAAESRAWGDAIRTALGDAVHRLSLSGTPFRSDQNAIPFVRYRNDLAEPDYEYGYAEALADRRVVRPVYFPRIGGHMEWTAPDGTDYSHSFDDRIGGVLASQRLRSALSVEQEWLPTVLKQADVQLRELRAVDPRAGAMVIAMDQDHARGIQKLLRDETGVLASIATSDDPLASEKIGEFSRSAAPWLVAVRMVSEGVDIPRLRVGVYATHTVTELFFRQAVGRLVRWTPGVDPQPAFMFIPDDMRIRGFAQYIQAERRHSLRKRDVADDDPWRRPPKEEEPPTPQADDGTGAKQMSLFSVISAVATQPPGPPLGSVVSPSPAVVAEVSPEVPQEEDTEELLIPVLAPSLAMFPPPTLGTPAVATSESDSSPEPLLMRRRDLRERNTALVQLIARRAGKSHAEVNAELNRGAGIRRIGEATTRELQKRIELAAAWLRKLGTP